MMSNLKYDNPRTNEIDNFLKYIYNINRSNPSIAVNKALVSNELRRYGLKQTDMGNDRSFLEIRKYFPEWANHYSNVSTCFGHVLPGNTYFYHFKNLFYRGDPDNFIKLYVPIDKDHIFNGVNILMNYIASLNIRHYSKVASEIRSDDVVIRLDADDVENTEKIINFINSNPYLKEGLNKVNPFVPSVNGIGIMNENGGTYNGMMSDSIAKYINECIGTGRVPNVYEFSEWIKNADVDVFVKSTYKVAIGGEEDRLTDEQKSQILIDSILRTYAKYGYKQTFGALKKAIETSDYSCFANDQAKKIDYRSLLQNNLDKDYLRNFINVSVSQIKGPHLYAYSTDQAINIYLSHIFKNDLITKVNDACNVILDKYDSNQVERALYNYIVFDDANLFSKFSVGSENDPYRVNHRLVIGKINKEAIVETLRNYLISRGYNVGQTRVQDLLKIYSRDLAYTRGNYYQNAYHSL
jgi:hypothetical protein